MLSDIDICLKIIVLGDSGVGKTSLLKKYIDNIFSNIHISTIGVDFYVNTIEYNNKKYKLQIWDTAGQEKFSNLIRSYFRNCTFAVILYDVSDYNSFIKIEHWINEFNSYTTYYRPIIIVGNKIDVMRKDTKITQKMKDNLINKYNTQIIYCSAKTGENISLLFEKIVEKIDHLLITGEIKENEFNGIRIYSKIKKFTIDEADTTSIKQKKCCVIL